MSNNSLRIIIDTNLWISFLIKNDYAKLDELVFQNKCVLLFSNELLQEFLAVVKRPKFRRYFSEADVENILETIDEFAEFVNVKSTIDVCRDPKDNFLLSLAADGKADILITGDKDLLELGYHHETRIITISAFLSE